MQPHEEDSQIIAHVLVPKSLVVRTYSAVQCTVTVSCDSEE
jgi:hypothetical protein